MSRCLAACALVLTLASAVVVGQDGVEYQTGTVQLTGGMARIVLPQSFKFLAEEGSRRVLKAWGNPPEAAEGVLGMLVPANLNPVSAEGWGIVITYEEDGYVDDDDARTLDYSKMLA